MKALLPPDGGPVAVTKGTYTNRGEGRPVVLVMIEIVGGPIITLEPYAWNDLVRRIRAETHEWKLGA